MKKFIAVLICIGILFANGAVFAEELVDVYIDGEQMEFDVPAQIIDDRTMVPMRAIFERLGAEVEWDEDNEMVIAIKNEKLITMKIGENYFAVANVLTNEVVRKELDVPSMILNDRTLVPVRAVAESLDCVVEWEEETQSVIITTKE